jgi:hypothetical protein
MTSPTNDQLDELREKLADVFDELCEPTNQFWHRDSALHYADKCIELFKPALAAQDKKSRVDELVLVKPGASFGLQKWIDRRIKALTSEHKGETDGR